MGMLSFQSRMVLPMKVFGKMINLMDKESKNQKMDQFMRVNSRMVKKMAMVNIYGLINLSIMGNGRIMNLMVKGCIFGVMAENTMDTGK